MLGGGVECTTVTTQSQPSPIPQVDDRLTLVLDLEARLQRMGQLAELYQAREAIFGLPTTDYPQIELIQKTFDPYASVRACGTNA